jgi:DNA polymerase-4
LTDFPIAVGGYANRRGVVATCNYKARAFGVRSAMATSQALQLCPDLIVLRPRGHLYQAVSRELGQLFHQFADAVQFIGLDEAYLALGKSISWNNALEHIESLRAQVVSTLGVTVSVGVAENKLLAKLASEVNKPNGFKIVSPQERHSFISATPVSRLPGVGPVMREKLAAWGVFVCSDLQQWSKEQLVNKFGAFGGVLFHACRGQDDRAVVTRWARKSVSVEQTFSVDISSDAEKVEQLQKLQTRLFTRWEALNSEYVIKKLFVKLKTTDFNSHTRETSIDELGGSLSADNKSELASTFEQLLHILPNDGPVRLLGVGFRLAVLPQATDIEEGDGQGDLFG